MNWKKYISEFATNESITNYSFNPPVPQFLLQDLQYQLGLQELPSELVELYKETNGIDAILNGEKIGELIWSVERVIETNKEYRIHQSFKELYMPFDQLLFVSDAGNGDLFAFVILAGRFDRYDMFVWNHENDSRTWIAPNLTKFLEWWTNGTIQL